MESSHGMALSIHFYDIHSLRHSELKHTVIYFLK